MTEGTAKSSRLDKARSIGSHFIRNENGILFIVLIALIAGFGILTKGSSTTFKNVTNVLLQSSIRGIASVGEAFVILSAGIDVSIGGIGMFCALLGAGLMTSGTEGITTQPISMYIVLPLMVLAGLAWGSLNGILVSRIRMPSLIVTLGMWEISSGSAFQMSGGFSIGSQPAALAFFGQESVGVVPVPVIIFIVVAVIAYFILGHTVFGRQIYASGGNPVSAWLSGTNVKKIQFAVFAIAGLLAGIAGIVVTARVMSASMRSLEGLELDSIAAVCVGGISLMGGRGNVIGVVIGVLIIGVINNAMSLLNAGPAVQGIVKGVIIITAVAIDYIRRRER